MRAPLMASGMKQVDIDSLKPDPANVRKHDERNLSAIRASKGQA